MYRPKLATKKKEKIKAIRDYSTKFASPGAELSFALWITMTNSLLKAALQCCTEGSSLLKI
jgi:hypothetical protein